jgi:hypothetical protein
MTKVERVLCYVFLLFAPALSFCTAQPQSKPQAAAQGQKQKVPVMDGEAGPCSLELTVLTEDAKPVYAATVKVHMAYGFAGIRRLDLEAGTNSDGKVKFIGLPSRVHRPPLEFHGSKDQLSGTAAYDPASECQAKHDLVLEASKPHAKEGDAN